MSCGHVVMTTLWISGVSLFAGTVDLLCPNRALVFLLTRPRLSQPSAKWGTSRASRRAERCEDWPADSVPLELHPDMDKMVNNGRSPDFLYARHVCTECGLSEHKRALLLLLSGRLCRQRGRPINTQEQQKTFKKIFIKLFYFFTSTLDHTIRGPITEPWGTPVNTVYGVQVVQYKGLYTRNNVDTVRITWSNVQYCLLLCKHIKESNIQKIWVCIYMIDTSMTLIFTSSSSSSWTVFMIHIYKCMEWRFVQFYLI